VDAQRKEISMPIWWNQVPGCFWGYGSGDFTTEEYNRFLDDYSRMEKGAHFFIDYNMKPLTAAQRGQMGTMLKEKVGDRLISFAMVSDSTVMRGIVTAVTWLFPPSYDMTIVKDPDAGLAWLSKAYPEFSSQQVRDDMLRKIPTEAVHHAWRPAARKAG
jgi:hypothetical protein